MYIAYLSSMVIEMNKVCIWLLQSVLQYFLAGMGSGPGYFQINRTTGVISVASNLRLGEEQTFMVNFYNCNRWNNLTYNQTIP